MSEREERATVPEYYRSERGRLALIARLLDIAAEMPEPEAQPITWAAALLRGQQVEQTEDWGRALELALAEHGIALEPPDDVAAIARSLEQHIVYDDEGDPALLVSARQQDEADAALERLWHLVVEGWVPNWGLDGPDLHSGMTGNVPARECEFVAGTRPFTQDTWTPATLIIHAEPVAPADGREGER